ncbi:hypothetical protein P7K49_040658 [Saguinus oedipus]|uniref:Uncharacterized protein n=1 Tax=Saguinus oedipus TaxID=9490 RepID=A0ABQ9T949_SAGOE|nr:hypothetical protein P7K49_040658 [Saguinus oedipus]
MLYVAVRELSARAAERAQALADDLLAVLMIRSFESKPGRKATPVSAKPPMTREEDVKGQVSNRPPVFRMSLFRLWRTDPAGNDVKESWMWLVKADCYCYEA